MDETYQPPGFASVAVNPRFQQHEATLLNALLQSSDYGVLLSGLDREDILANRRLGELFSVSPQEVVRTDPNAVRAIALSRVRDPQAFETVVARLYAEPLRSQADEIELLGNPPRFLHRYTAPIFGADGQPVGRLWTFLDITPTRRLQSEVQAQLQARTHESLVTSEILRAMNALCSVSILPDARADLLTAIVQQTRGLADADCAALLLFPDPLAYTGLRISASSPLAGVACAPGKPPRLVQTTLAREKLCAQAIRSISRQPGQDPCAEALLTLQPDYTGQLARWMTCRVVAAVPLCHQGHLMGVFALGILAAEPAVETEPDDPGSDGGDLAQSAAPLASVTPDASLFHPALRHLPALANQVALTLQTHHLQLELHAAMDTLQITQRRMVEMEKLRTAGTLAASVAHDIRNILAAMQMDLEAADLPAQVGEGLNDHLNRFSALTHRLLAFSRPGKLEMRPTRLNEVVSRVVSLVAGQAQINRVQITLDFADTLPPVAADASQMEHLFVNLCLNAIQSMTLKGGDLRLQGATDRKRLLVRISDTGTGIAPDTLGRIFEPFFTTRATGTGLGLFSCRRIVEDHGGVLSVSATGTGGTTFLVSLPTLGR